MTEITNPDNSSTAWYYYDGKQAVGPFDIETLTTLRRAGIIADETQVQSATGGEWLAYSKFQSDMSGREESVEDAVEHLKRALLKLHPGAVSEEYVPAVLNALEAAWPLFSGCGEESTFASKVHRAESLRWEAPLLSFILERHGRTVYGSSRADLHYWQINLDTREAYIIKNSTRQLRPIDRPLKVQPIAEKLADAIVNQREEEVIVRKSPSLVYLKIGQIIPETYKQTTASRRKRLRKALTEALKPTGWNEVRPNVYEKN
jgi:hypothetical protein